MNYKHKTTGIVINESCYWKLQFSQRLYYTPCEEGATHKMEEDENSTLWNAVALGTEIISDIFSSDSSSSPDTSSPDFGGFGGGESGGSGAGSDF